MEAGPDYPPPRYPPFEIDNGLAPDLVTHDWGLYLSGPLGRRIPAPRGKVVGGSSATNTCIGLRPEPGDFERWASIVGSADWDWQHALRKFIELEDDRDFDDKHHGHGGPVPIQRWKPRELIPVSASFIKACIAAGYRYNNDLNAPDSSGIGLLPMNLINGIRQSMARCYLSTVRRQSNLHIRSNTEVHRILFDGTCARGVELTDGSQVHADRIILCSGTYANPSILLRSGVGSVDELAPIGVEPIVPLPGVGKGLYDHPQCFVAAETCDNLVPDRTPCAQALLRYTSATARRTNDLQLSLLNYVDMDHFSPELADKVESHSALMLMTQLEDPVASGSVSILSKEIGGTVRIELDYCSEPDDLRRLREGIALAWNIANSPDFSPHISGVLNLDNGTVNDVERLDNFIYNNVATGHHPVGTCKMGKRSDSSSVVDAQGRVLGANGLWIADASVIPFPVRANTNLTCIVLAEIVAGCLRRSTTLSSA